MPGHVIGSIVAAAFGAVFVVVNSNELPAALRIVIIALALAMASIVLVRGSWRRGIRDLTRGRIGDWADGSPRPWPSR